MSLIHMTDKQRSEWHANPTTPVWANSPDDEGLIQVGIWRGNPANFTDASRDYVRAGEEKQKHEPKR